ncbi:hypothetical protein HGO21_03455 [Acinetobacter sp. CUI P1]|nr:hypothetical protein [Acinetobacter sp. CUI P1]
MGILDGFYNVNKLTSTNDNFDELTGTKTDLSKITINNILEELRNTSVNNVATFFGIDINFLMNQLKKNKYEKRWLEHTKGSGYFKSKSKDLQKILGELNTKGSDLAKVSKDFGFEVEYLINLFRKYNIKETWIYETEKCSPFSKASFTNIDIVTDLNSGKLIYLNYSGKRLIDNYQVDAIIGPSSIYNARKKLLENTHYLSIEKNVLEEVTKALPHLNYLNDAMFYTTGGTLLLGEYTNRTIHLKKLLNVYLRKYMPEYDNKSDNNDDIIITKNRDITSDNIINTTDDSKIEHKTVNTFTENDFEILLEIIQERKIQKSNYTINVELTEEISNKLLKYKNQYNLSQSKIIEMALIDFFSPRDG